MNPLNSIINISGIAEKQQIQEKKMKQKIEDFITYFQIINTSSRMMHLMVKSQIDIQQIKQNCFMQKVTKQHPADQLMKVAELFEMQIKQKQLKFEVKIDFDQTVKYQGEWERYQQIVVNFMQNAVKFTPQGEISVYLSIATDDSGQSVNIERSKFQDKCSKCGFLVTKIVDSGIGMTESTKQSLFQLFKSSSVTENGMIGSSGIGLGLSMSYDLLKQLNGVVNVESMHQHGTEVTFKINVQHEFCKKQHQFSADDYFNKSLAIRIPISECFSPVQQKSPNTMMSPPTITRSKNLKKRQNKSPRHFFQSKGSFRAPFQEAKTPTNLSNKNESNLLTPNTRRNQNRRIFGDDLNFNTLLKCRENSIYRENQQSSLNLVKNQDQDSNKISSMNILALGKIESLSSSNLNLSNKDKFNMNNFEKYFKKHIMKAIAPSKPQSIFNINFNVQSSNSNNSSPFGRGKHNFQQKHEIKEKDLEMGDIWSSNLFQRRNMQKQQKKNNKQSIGKRKLSFIKKNDNSPKDSSRLKLLIQQKSCAQNEESQINGRNSEQINDFQSFKSSPFKKSNNIFFNGNIFDKSDNSNIQCETPEAQLSQGIFNNRIKLPDTYAFEIKKNLINIKEGDRQKIIQREDPQTNQSILKPLPLSKYSDYSFCKKKQSNKFSNQTFYAMNMQNSTHKFNNQEIQSNDQKLFDSHIALENIDVQLVDEESKYQPKNKTITQVQTSTFLNCPESKSQELIGNSLQLLEGNRKKLINYNPLAQNRRMTLGMQSNEYDIEQFKGLFGALSQQQHVDNLEFKDLMNTDFYSQQNKSQSHKKKSNKELVSMMNIQPIREQSQDFNDDEKELQLDQKTGKFQTNPLKQLSDSLQQHDLADSELLSLIESSRTNLQLQLNCDCEAQIMIVDDSMFNLIPLELMLQNINNLQVIKAYNGLEAVNLYKERLQKTCCNNKFKLIFMDLNMPIMDGYQATQNIIQLFNEKYQKGSYNNGDQLNIVAITAFVNEENINHCYAVGMKEVLHKPVDQDSLKEVINQYYFTYSKQPYNKV
eukprot:403347751